VTPKKEKKDGLVGLFLLRRDGQRQGVIEQYVINGFYLVRWNSWVTGGQMSMLAVLSLEEVAKDYDLYDDADEWRAAGDRACQRIAKALKKTEST
jgi:hypothetical protein